MGAKLEFEIVHGLPCGTIGKIEMGSVDHCIATFPNHASCIMDLFMWSAPCQLVQPLFSIFPPSHFISDVEEWETVELVTQESPRASANVSCHGRAECPKWTKDTWVS